MKCPNCQTNCPDDTSFCPKCDAVLDRSLLEMSLNAPGDEGDFAPPPRALATADRPQRRRPAAGRTEPVARPRHHRPPEGSRSGPSERPRKRRPAPITSSEGEVIAETTQQRQPANGSGGYVSKYAQYWEDDEPAPAHKAESPVMATEGGRSFRYGEGIQVSEYDTGDLNALPNDPLAMVKGVWKAFLALPLFQRAYAAASALLFFCSMVPWCTFIGESGYPESDYVPANFLGLLLPATALFALVLQKSNLLPQIPRRHLPLVPLAAGALGALSIILTAIYLLASSVYSPSWFGLVTAFISSCLMFAGCGLSLMKRE